MQQIRKSAWSRFLAQLLTVALLTPYLFLSVGEAEAQMGRSVTAVVVLPIADQSGHSSDLIVREATAAVALALEDTREFLVSSSADIEREMSSLGMRFPLGTAEQLRLGKWMRVDKVLTGTVTAASVDAKTGRARVDIQIKMLDVEIGEYLDGAIESITTSAVPGWTGEASQVLNEALRNAAESAVSKMLGSRVQSGTVELVDDRGNININLGFDDGIVDGSDLLVIRPTWQPDLEELIGRRVGVISITNAQAKMSIAKRKEGGTPRTGDKIYRIYKPIELAMREARGKKMKNTGKMTAGILLLAGLLGIARGSHTSSPSSMTGGLTQARPGAQPFVRLTLYTGHSAGEPTHGWLFFRAANNPDFPAVPQFLIDAIPGKRLNFYSDDPFEARVVENFSIEFQYFGIGRDLEDGDVEVSYNKMPLTRGTSYYYRVCRVTDPQFPPGTNPPIGTAQAIEPTTPEINPSPDWSIISRPSPSYGPITFFTPPIQSLPTDGAANLTAQDITFSWQPSTGANEYIVQVFPGNDPDGIRSPILQSAPTRSTGATIMSSTIRGPFQSGQQYWWRVGARRTGDVSMPLNQLTGQAGWLFSDMRSFNVADGPPPPPGTSDTVNRPVPSHRGLWGTGRGSQR